MKYSFYFTEHLKKLKSLGLYRSIAKIDTGCLKYINMGGRSYLNLASNNYLGLSESNYIKQAACNAIKHYGCSSSSSRIVTGNYLLYDELENKIAKFKSTQRALVYNTGFIANLSTISSIANEEWVIFSDKLNHASIIDGVRFSKAKFTIFRHNDMNHLENIMKKYNQYKHKLIITDSVFSMDGDIADLKALSCISKRFDAFLMVDEAHATGIFGKGKGLVHQFKVENDVDIQMGTFSKALGSFGAFIATNKETVEYLVNTARGFIFSTSLPPSVIAANIAAIDYVEKHPDIGEKLLKISEDFRDFLKKLGFDTINSFSQIIPIVMGSINKLFKARDFLMEKGIFVASIRYPTVPKGTERLRLSLRIDLNQNDLSLLKEAFKELSEWM